MNKHYGIGLIPPIEVGTELDMEVMNQGDGVRIIVEDPGPAHPIEIKEIGDGYQVDETIARQYHYYGIVKDADSGAPLPGATVKIYLGSQLLTAGAADNDGQFDFYVPAEGDTIIITSAGYQGKQFGGSLIRHDFELQKDEKDLDPVIVTAIKKNSKWLLLLMGVAVVADQTQKGKKKVSGGINSTWVIAGAGLIFFWPLIKGLFSAFGFAGDILSAPSDFIEGLKKQTSQDIHDMLFESVKNYVQANTYNPGNSKDVERMQKLTTDYSAMLTPSEISYLVAEYKKPKQLTDLSRGALMAAHLELMKNLYSRIF